MTPLRAFSSILCVLLASVVGLVLSLIHPGWAVRLTRHVSRRMVGGRGSRRSSGRRTSRKPVHGKRSLATKGLDHDNTLSSQSASREWGTTTPVWDKGTRSGSGVHGHVQGDMQTMPIHTERRSGGETAILGKDGQTREVQSALTNLGMTRPVARKLAKQAVVGRDFDSALRWAIANGRAA